MELSSADHELDPATVETLQGKLAAFEAELDRTRVELKRTRIERDYFELRYKAQLRRLYGSSSEQWSSKQDDLFFNEAETLARGPEEVAVRVASHAKRKPGRRPSDASLPREVVRHELPASERVCAHDGTVLEAIGVEVSEQLDIVPAVVRVLRHERVKYACPCCHRGVVTAPGPRRLVPKGVLSEGSLAWVVTAKYQDALPLYRQAGILKRFGGELGRGRLAANVMRAGQAVQPLVNLLRERLLDAAVVHGDETQVQVLKEPGRAAQTKSWLWVQCSGSSPPVRLITYAPSRSAKTAVELYDGARGALMSDGYEV
ncbi:MAG: IS66 family transposase [Gammaproteobacteria bacterium]|jgi:transposase|nr:IS66 family transposase [Gammaproteobacteria bacterium]